MPENQKGGEGVMITRVLLSFIAAVITWYLCRVVGSVVPMGSHLFAIVPPVSQLALWALPVVVFLAAVAVSAHSGLQKLRIIGAAMIASGLVVAVVPVAAQWEGTAAIAVLLAVSVLAFLLVAYGAIALRYPQAFVIR